MKQTIKGWTVGLIHQKGYKFFLGRNKSSEGVWYADTYTSPCEYPVYAHLFKTADEALEFWKTCYYEPYEGKGVFVPIPVEIELSVEVKGLGFSWNGLINT